MIKINNQINARDARASDIIHWYKWFNDEKITKWLIHGKIPNTIEQQEKFYKMHSTGDNGKIIFILCDAKKIICPWVCVRLIMIQEIYLLEDLK